MSDIIMLPTAAIEQAKNCYKMSRELINTKTKPADLAAAKILINDKLKRFELLADSAIKSAHTDHQVTAKCTKKSPRKTLFSAH